LRFVTGSTALVTVTVLVACGSGKPSSTASTGSGALRDVTRTFAGVTCSWPSGTAEGAALCHRVRGGGLAGIESFEFVGVTRRHKYVFYKNQPRRTGEFGPIVDRRISHSETHRGIVCFWTKTSGGGAFCNRADNRGYVVGVGTEVVLVIDQASRVVFLRNQP
jgi:hypothetical protein